MDQKALRKRLAEKGLKVTSRRLLILEAITELKHPATDEIISNIRKKNPDIASATVYKALNVLLGKHVISRVTTEEGVSRFDAIPESHHHLYCSEINRIEDYCNDELTGMLRNYFKTRKIKGFRIEDFKLQIIGKFTD